MTSFASEHPVLVASVLIVCIVGFVAIVAGALLLGRSLKVDVGIIHAELKPNGGNSFRDEMDKRFDRVERQANRAVARAEDAATQAHFAAQHAAGALDRIERLEASHSSASAVVVVPSPAPPPEHPTPNDG